MNHPRLLACAVIPLLATGLFGQQKPSPESNPGNGDLFWKKLDQRVGEIVDRFDGDSSLIPCC
jgi:hypothetical protein